MENPPSPLMVRCIYCTYDDIPGYFSKRTLPNGSQNLCSPASERRGAGQKVVSFSFYGPLLGGKYWDGIRVNLDLITDLYPGWVLRLYVSRDANSLATMEELCSLQCSSPQ